jgi:hypothetical protein
MNDASVAVSGTSNTIQIQLPWCKVHVTSLKDLVRVPSLSSSSGAAANAANAANAAALAAAYAVEDDDDDSTPKDTHYGSLLTATESELPPVGQVEHSAANVAQALARAALRQSHWLPKEKQLFEVAMYECDKDFERCSTIVKTKSVTNGGHPRILLNREMRAKRLI